MLCTWSAPPTKLCLWRTCTVVQSLMDYFYGAFILLDYVRFGALHLLLPLNCYASCAKIMTILICEWTVLLIADFLFCFTMACRYSASRAELTLNLTHCAGKRTPLLLHSTHPSLSPWSSWEDGRGRDELSFVITEVNTLTSPCTGIDGVIGIHNDHLVMWHLYICL